MTLEELVYQINGALRQRVEGNSCVVVYLSDNIGNDVMFKKEGHCTIRAAQAKGESMAQARQNLVMLLRRSVVLHNWQVSWGALPASLRVPETLIA